MFVALDAEGNRIYANSAEKNVKCFCPVCNEELRLRKGSKNKPHFAHRQDTDCLHGKNPDYKSEWHIRMQEYFPREACEVRFVDNETGEVHIADVFLEASNTVLEFQHSPISEEEFHSRTIFHLKNGRRIVWLFDESSSSKESTFGRFRYDEEWYWPGVPFYKWLRNPRGFLSNGPDLKQASSIYSVCVFTGTEGDIFHRIIAQESNFHRVRFSSETIQMGPELNVDVFFNYDSYWVGEDEAIAQRRAYDEHIAYQNYQLAKNIPRLYTQKIFRRKRRF